MTTLSDRFKACGFAISLQVLDHAQGEYDAAARHITRLVPSPLPIADDVLQSLDYQTAQARLDDADKTQLKIVKALAVAYPSELSNVQAARAKLWRQNNRNK